MRDIMIGNVWMETPMEDNEGEGGKMSGSPMSSVQSKVMD